MLVGVEFAGHHGFTFAHDLARRGYQIVTVLPSATKRLKDVGTNRTRKSDDIDAWQICKLIGQGAYVTYPLLDPIYTSLRLLTTARRRLSHEQVRFKNRLQGLLDLAWHEFLRFFANLEQETLVAILQRWPLPEDFAAARKKQVHDLIRAASRNHVKPERIEALRTSARETVALATAGDVRRLEITDHLARWALVRQQFDATIRGSPRSSSSAPPPVRSRPFRRSDPSAPPPSFPRWAPRWTSSPLVRSWRSPAWTSRTGVAGPRCAPVDGSPSAAARCSAESSSSSPAAG